MRRITLWMVGTVCAVVLVIGFQISRDSDRGSQHAGSDSGDASTGTEPSTGTSVASGKTYDGEVVETRFGDVQVRVVIADGAIVDVVALKTPGGDHHNVEINNRAVPILRKAVLAAQSAEIDSVSGATYTSEAYRESLQSALDAANFKA